MSFHIERLQELMMRELASLVEKDDVIGRAHALVTVARIELDKNMQNAKVFVRVFPETEAAGIYSHLRDKAPDFRHALGKRIRLKSIPRLYFQAYMEEDAQT